MTLLGLGAFPASHPLNLGMMGMHGEAWVNTAIQEADLLIALGMRFDDRVTGTLKTYAPNAKKIHVEIDPAEVNKNVPVDVALIGDLRAACLHRPAARASPAVAAPDSRVSTAHPGSPTSPNSRARSPSATSRTFPTTAISTPRTSSPTCGARPAARPSWSPTSASTRCGRRSTTSTKTPHTLITSGGLGTMGFALPAAIGAKFARPDEEVWVVVGDGGFQMTMSELATIVQEELDIKIAIINNGYLGMVRQWQEFFYDRRYHATPLVNPDFEKLAQAFGLHAMTVSNALRSDSRGAGRARASRDRGHQFLRGAGRLGLPHGSRRRRFARDDPPPQPLVEAATDS